MKFTEIKSEGLNKEIKINIDSSTIESKILEEANKILKTYKRPGFRPGKYPLTAFLKENNAALRTDILNKECQTAVEKLISDNNYNLAGDPTIASETNEQSKDFAFVLKFTLLPEISQPDLSSITIDKPQLVLNAEDMDNKFEEFKKNFKTYNKASAKTKAKLGDQVLIDFEGFIDNIGFKEGKGENFEIVLGSKIAIPGFEDQLVGVKEGDDKTLELTFPAKYHVKHLAGKDAEFKVHVREVRNPQPFEINKEFLDKFNVDSIETLQKRVIDQAHAEYAASINTILKVKLFDALDAKLNFELPQTLVEKELHNLRKHLDNIEQTESNDSNSKEHNVAAIDNELQDAKLNQKEDSEANIDDAPKTTKKVSKKIKIVESKEDKYYKIAVRRVKVGLFLSEYAKIHKINITNEDLNNAVLAQMRSYPGQEQAIIDFYRNNKGAVETLRGPIIEDKAVQRIFASDVKLEPKDYTMAELDAYLDKENDIDI